MHLCWTLRTTQTRWHPACPSVAPGHLNGLTVQLYMQWEHKWLDDDTNNDCAHLCCLALSFQSLERLQALREGAMYEWKRGAVLVGLTEFTNSMKSDWIPFEPVYVSFASPAKGHKWAQILRIVIECPVSIRIIALLNNQADKNQHLVFLEFLPWAWFVSCESTQWVQIHIFVYTTA